MIQTSRLFTHIITFLDKIVKINLIGSVFSQYRLFAIRSINFSVLCLIAAYVNLTTKYKYKQPKLTSNLAER
jgi:hypothetical protein